MLTGAYPPQEGGVSDYSRLVARGLADAGDEVHVWTSACGEPTLEELGVTVHRLPDRFGLPGLTRLHAEFNRLPGSCRVLIQYVPNAFGWKAMNIPLCLWLFSQRRYDVSTMFHEVAFPFRRRQPVSHQVLAAVTRGMAALVVRASRRIFVAIPAWGPTLRQLGSRHSVIEWLPVPSNIATRVQRAAVLATREKLGLGGDATVIGHFGTYPPGIACMLEPTLAALLRGRRCHALLLGRGGAPFAEAFTDRYPDLRGRLCAPGGMASDDLAAHIATCDVLVQPYPDGASSRRTSLMAALALGMPIVTTDGLLSEPVWRETGAVRLVPADAISELAVAADALLGDRAAREALGTRAAALYAERFALEHTVRALRQ